MRNESFTTEEIARILKVSKLTVYDLIKKGELRSYRVGRQMRVDATDLENYKRKAKGLTFIEEQRVTDVTVNSLHSIQTPASNRSIIISGQDMSLDILCKYIEKQTKLYRPLRSYVGSLESLYSMYKGEADIVSTHLIDGDTFEYNIPYIRKLFVSEHFIVINLISRWAGFYVKSGNPLHIQTWRDLVKKDVTFVNREKGSGARTFVDEMLRIHNIIDSEINGYEDEETSHLTVAGRIAKGLADVGVGIEKAARMVEVDFIPLTKERYDLVILKTEENKELIKLLSNILQSDEFKKELSSIGYDISQTGIVIFEQ
ncbi:helix-turn-helix transcriptional regulator [Calidifontibacillus oryziterrae]|uniref:helix-turn-helix transcriptional regulator n=1 Tax=Calidifontibacillus oryziterrae TaxID=1191699 RepID=UPI0002EE6F9D|nr:helix-turn-helix transcriptional regulator [Calidifontibacillus oryziterrae]